MIPWIVPPKGVSVERYHMEKNSGFSIYTAFAIAALTTLIAYLPTLNYKFMFDDAPTIVENFYLKLQSYGDMFFAHSRWVSNMINAFTYHTWGLNPYYFRVFNISLHILNAFLLFLIFKTLLHGLKKSDFAQKHANIISFLASAIFMLHPVQTQTATYITQMRLEGLATFFVLAIIGCLVLFSKLKHIGAKIAICAAATIFSALAAGTKEIVVVIPFLLAMIDLFFISQWQWKKFINQIPMHIAVSIALYGAFYSFSFSSTVPFSLTNVVRLDAALDCNRGNLLTESPTVKITALRYLISEFKVLLHYITIFFWPFNLSFDYDYVMAKTFWQFDVIFPLLALLSIFSTSIFLWWKKRSNLISFSLFWFLLSVGPRTSIVPSAEMANDYKTYLGSVGMTLLLAYLTIWALSFVAEFLRQNYWKASDKTYQAIFSVLLLSLSYNATTRRTDVWSSDLKFWGDVIRKAPQTSRGYNNYAVAMANSGHEEEALEFYKKSAELDKYYAEPLINLGSHYQIKGDDDTALHYYGKALNLKHEPHPECYNNVGLIQYKHKNYDKAESCFKTAIALRGHHGKAYYNLSKVYYDKKEIPKAYEASCSALKSDFVKPHVRLLHGKCAVLLGKYREGIISLEQAVKRGPDFDGIFKLATAYYNEREYKKACMNFEKAYKHQPSNLACAYNYAQALMNSGRYAEAIPLFEQTSKETERFPFSQLHISKCLSKNGNHRAAMQKVEKLAKGPRTPKQVRKDAVALRDEIFEASMPTRLA
ncbi:tetratricopeptide repeat protein [Candidatus Dependentiae bacterium]